MRQAIGRTCVAWMAVWLTLGLAVPCVAGTDYLPPTRPANVIRNIASAYLERDADGYLECLAEDFLFVPHPDRPGLFGEDPPVPWGKATADTIHRVMFAGGPRVPRFRSIALEPWGTPFWDEEHGHPDWLVFRINARLDVLLRYRSVRVKTGHTVYLRRADADGGRWEIVLWEEGPEFQGEEPPDCSAGAPHRQVIADFHRGAIELPPGVECALLEDVTVTPGTVESVLVSHDVELVMKAFPGFDRADTLGVARRTGEVVRLADFSQTYRFRLPEDGDQVSLVDDLEALGEWVLYAELDGTGPPESDEADPPNDYYWDEGTWGQWYLDHEEYSHIRALTAWDYTTGSEGVTMAVLDRGFTNEHEDLAGRVLEEYSDDGWTVTPQSLRAHGFLVACVAAANTNNEVGLAGVDWHARLISKRTDGMSTFADVEELLSAAAPYSDILNTSWHYDYYSITARRAFADAYKLNCVEVAAMGSRGQTEPLYPAAFGQGVIAVGSTTTIGGHPTFSATGDHIDVAAPGWLIVGCEPQEDPPYLRQDGTSFSAPLVAGIAGLLIAERPDLYNDDVEQLIRLTADDVGDPGFDIESGMGRVNAGRALEWLQEPYALSHWEVQGASRYEDDGFIQVRFIDEPLIGGPYVYWPVIRYEVERDVTFPREFWDEPNVWSRGVAMGGGGYPKTNDGGLLYGQMGWCEAVEGTVTRTGCTLRTYVYDVRELSGGGHLVWIPCHPNDVVLAYSAHGEPAPETGVSELDTDPKVSRLVLQPPNPNPCSGQTTLAIECPQEMTVVLAVYSATGRLVRELWKGPVAPGSHQFPWDGKDENGAQVASGIYFVRLEGESGASDGKLVVVR